jgi:hypothetical protein
LVADAALDEGDPAGRVDRAFAEFGRQEQHVARLNRIHVAGPFDLAAAGRLQDHHDPAFPFRPDRESMVAGPAAHREVLASHEFLPAVARGSGLNRIAGAGREVRRREPLLQMQLARAAPVVQAIRDVRCLLNLE